MPKRSTIDYSIPFNPVDRPITHVLSPSNIVRQHIQKTVESRPRLPGSIHFSDFWKCPRQMLWKAYGKQFTDWTFRWYNQEAAAAGDAIHGLVQKEMLEAGLIVQVPVYEVPLEAYFAEGLTKEQLESERLAMLDIRRNLGETQPAIELTIGDWARPADDFVRAVYREKGIFLPENEVYEEYSYLKWGGRLDTVVRLPEWAFSIARREVYYCDIPNELKTVASKYWEGGDNEKYMYGPKGKWAHYFFQLQMQLHYYRCSHCGKRPEFGIITLINRDDTSARVEKIVPYDAEFVAEWLPKIEQIMLAWEAGEVPEGVPDEDDCRFCEFWSACDNLNKYPKFVDFNKIRANSAARKEAEELYLEALMEAS